MPSSSAPLTNTNGGYEMRIYDQVMLRAMGEAQTSPLSKYRPTKKETMRHAHQTRGGGACEPTRVHNNDQELPGNRFWSSQFKSGLSFIYF